MSWFRRLYSSLKANFKKQNRRHYAHTYITPKNLTIQKRTYVYLWMIHFDVWQKTTQYCKAVILQLKINKAKIENKM